MNEFEAYARSSAFAVRDLDAFVEAMAAFGVEIEVSRSAEGTKTCCTLLSRNESGWPTTRFDPIAQEIVTVDFPSLIAQHLEVGQVAILMDVGWRGLHYLTGSASAIQSTGVVSRVNLVGVNPLRLD